MNFIILITFFGSMILFLCIARGPQLLILYVLKKNTKTYADIKARRKRLDEWEQQFDDEYHDMMKGKR